MKATCSSADLWLCGFDLSMHRIVIQHSAPPVHLSAGRPRHAFGRPCHAVSLRTPRHAFALFAFLLLLLLFILFLLFLRVLLLVLVVASVAEQAARRKQRRVRPRRASLGDIYQTGLALPRDLRILRIIVFLHPEARG